VDVINPNKYITYPNVKHKGFIVTNYALHFKANEVKIHQTLNNFNDNVISPNNVRNIYK
jgi:hypothetical protein